MAAVVHHDSSETGAPEIDWSRVAETVLTSRALDELEESRLVSARKVLYQFTARGHDVTQALLGQMLTGVRDGVALYYRSRPLMLSLGLPLETALASTMMRTGGVSEGRDIGVVFNLPRRDGPCVLPACGGVGTQYTPAVGWAQAIRYHSQVLRDAKWSGSIAIAHGGEASTATNGFWSALNIATTQRLPVLFFIEDNGYGISVPSGYQTPGGNIAANLAAFRNLAIFDGSGSDPCGAALQIAQALATVRAGVGPALLRLTVPRLSGHSGQDTQTYKTGDELAAERARSAHRPARARRAGAAQRGGVGGARAAREGGRGARAHGRRAACAAGCRSSHALRVQRTARRRRDRSAAPGGPPR